MTSAEIKAIIICELQVERDLKNVSGLDLKKCLIEPIKQKYTDVNDSMRVNEYWTVLEESEDGKGYKIYFDEETKMFGLAILSNKNERIDIGIYGTFLETLYSM